MPRVLALATDDKSQDVNATVLMCGNTTVSDVTARGEQR